MSTQRTLFAMLLSTTIAHGALAAGWYNYNWGYRQEILISHTAVSGTVAPISLTAPMGTICLHP